MQLVIRSKLQPHESLNGYLLRLATLNRYPGMAPILRAAELQYCHGTLSYRPEAPSLWGLARVVGVRPEPLRAAGYWRTADAPLHSFGRHLVRQGQLQLVHPTVCPACLREWGICRKLWDLRAYCACHKHGCQLIQACPECGKRLCWRRHTLTWCSCGCDFAGISTPAASEGAMRISQAVKDVAHGEPSELAPTMSLRAFLQLAMMLGAPADEPLDMRGLQLKSLTQSYQNADRADRYLSSWPEGLHLWLRERWVDEDSVSLHRAFGGVLDQVLRAFSNPTGTFVIEEIRAFLARYWQGVSPSKYFNVRSGRTRYISVHAAAKSLGLHWSTVGELVLDGQLAGVVRQNGRVRAFAVDAVAVRETVREGGYITRKDLLHLLSVSRHAALQLRRMGLIHEVISRANDLLFARRDADALLARFAALACEPPQGELYPLPAVAARRAFGKVVRAVLEGEVALYWLQRDAQGRGLASFAVSKTELLTRMGFGGETYLRSEAAAARVGIKSEQLTLMRRMGLISSEPGEYLYSEALIRRIHRDFMLAREIGELMAMSGAAVRKWAAERRLFPVIGPRHGRRMSALWRTQAIERALGRKIERNLRAPGEDARSS